MKVDATLKGKCLQGTNVDECVGTASRTARAEHETLNEQRARQHSTTSSRPPNKKDLFSGQSRRRRHKQQGRLLRLTTGGLTHIEHVIFLNILVIDGDDCEAESSQLSSGSQLRFD